MCQVDEHLPANSFISMHVCPKYAREKSFKYMYVFDKSNLHVFKHGLQVISSVYILADLYVGHGLTLNGITNTVYFCKPRIPKERRRKLFIIFEAFTFDTLKPLKLYLPGCKAHQFSYHFIM